jgi:hypothetical protein
MQLGYTFYSTCQLRGYSGPTTNVILFYVFFQSYWLDIPPANIRYDIPYRGFCRLPGVPVRESIISILKIIPSKSLP